MQHKLKLVNKDKKLRILGPHTKTVYGKEVDLRDFTYDNVRHQLGATFSHLQFFDLSKLGPNWKNNKNLWNLGVRAEQNDRDHIDALKASFRLDGFSNKFPLPCYGEDGKFRDGRSRIIGTKEDEESWIPVAVYDYSDETDRDFITNGLISNDHPPAKRFSMKDFISAGSTLAIKGDVSPDEDSILDWLHHEAQIGQWTRHAATITKIKKEIIKSYNDNVKFGTGQVRIQKREQWIPWLEQNGYNISGKEYHLYCVDNDTYSSRCFTDMILDINEILDDDYVVSKPFKVILYTNQLNPSAAIDSIHRFEERMETMYKRSHKMCGSLVGKPRPWKIVGAIPQIEDRHVTDGNDLVPLDQY